MVLTAANWLQNADHYEYTISSELITSTALLDLVINGNTKELVDVISAAQISGFSQSNGSLTIFCWGTVPSIDINATLIVRGGI